MAPAETAGREAKPSNKKKYATWALVVLQVAAWLVSLITLAGAFDELTGVCLVYGVLVKSRDARNSQSEPEVSVPVSRLLDHSPTLRCAQTRYCTGVTNNLTAAANNRVRMKCSHTSTIFERSCKFELGSENKRATCVMSPSPYADEGEVWDGTAAMREWAEKNCRDRIGNQAGKGEEKVCTGNKYDCADFCELAICNTWPMRFRFAFSLIFVAMTCPLLTEKFEKYKATQMEGAGEQTARNFLAGVRARGGNANRRAAAKGPPKGRCGKACWHVGIASAVGAACCRSCCLGCNACCRQGCAECKKCCAKKRSYADSAAAAAPTQAGPGVVQLPRWQPAMPMPTPGPGMRPPGAIVHGMQHGMHPGMRSQQAQQAPRTLEDELRAAGVGAEAAAGLRAWAQQRTRVEFTLAFLLVPLMSQTGAWMVRASARMNTNAVDSSGGFFVSVFATFAIMYVFALGMALAGLAGMPLGEGAHKQSPEDAFGTGLVMVAMFQLLLGVVALVFTDMWFQSFSFVLDEIAVPGWDDLVRQAGMAVSAMAGLSLAFLTAVRACVGSTVSRASSMAVAR